MGVSFSLSLSRKRAKTTLDWRGMRSPPCWKTPCLQRSKSFRSKAAAKEKLNGECAPAKLAAQQGGRATIPTEPGASAVGIPLPDISPHFRSTVLQQQFNRAGKAELGSVALPAIMRTGAGGPENFQVGTMPQPQLQITSGQMHRGHMPPLVSSPCADHRGQTLRGDCQACVDQSVWVHDQALPCCEEHGLCATGLMCLLAWLSQCPPAPSLQT